MIFEITITTANATTNKSTTNKQTNNNQTNNKQITNNKQSRQTTNNKQSRQTTSNKQSQQRTSNKKQTTNDQQPTTNNEQQTPSNTNKKTTSNKQQHSFTSFMPPWISAPSYNVLAILSYSTNPPRTDWMCGANFAHHFMTSSKRMGVRTTEREDRCVERAKNANDLTSDDCKHKVCSLLGKTSD